MRLEWGSILIRAVTIEQKRAMKIRFLGAAGEVTGSCFLITLGGRKLLVECGLFQGTADERQRNRNRFLFDPRQIDAVILTHAHIDHSGRLPLLAREGYTGPVFAHPATRDLCRVMLKDSAYLNEKEAQWLNRKRERRHEPLIEPLYTQADAEAVMGQFQAVEYRQVTEVLPGVSLRFRDAGHILGAAITELWLEEGGERRKVVFSGDLGQAGAPILADPETISEADLVVMESTYGDRLHRSREKTLQELKEIFAGVSASQGNILIPSFAVGRAQELLYLMARHFEEWDLGHWSIFLDSPMAIEATEIYGRYRNLHDAEARTMPALGQSLLPNLVFVRSSAESMALNHRRSGAVIIAGSGMCTGGRIRHHLKNHVWRSGCQVIFVGFQAAGTLGRKLVDGAKSIRLWGEKIQVGAQLHTVGGLSAHADQSGLVSWYRKISGHPPVVLVHGEAKAQSALRDVLLEAGAATVTIARRKQIIDLRKAIAPVSAAASDAPL